MSRYSDFEHLPLPLVLTGKPKLNGGGPVSEQTSLNRKNRVTHGGGLKRRATELSRFWRERQQERVQHNFPEIQVGIPILLEIDPNSDLDFLKGLGFEVISENQNGYIIVASEDVDLQILNEKIEGFINNINTRCNTPARIYALCEDSDRVEKILSETLYKNWDNLNPEEYFCVDIGVSCTGGKELPDRPSKNNGETDEHYASRINNWQRRFEEAYKAWDDIKSKREEIIENFVNAYEGEISAFFDDSSNMSALPDSFTARIKISGKGLRDIVLNFPYIFEVREAEIVSCPMSVAIDDNDNLNVTFEAPNYNASKICVIDSGVQEEHKYLSAAILKQDSKSYLPNADSVADEVKVGGHGTRVAGAVLYPNQIPREGSVKLNSWIRNLRVLNAENCMPEEIFPPKLIESIVYEYRVNSDNPSKVYNLSIGTRKPCELKHMSAWAAEIDQQSYSNDVLFVVSAGNVSKDIISAYIQAGYKYPEYLGRELCRICNPAQSLQSLTVGSINPSDYETEDLIGLGGKDQISSFSRSGPGIWDVIKPEVVEYGGSLVVPKEGEISFTTPPEVCPELIRKSPEGPAFAKDQIGTSFATPKVTNIVSQIENIYPDSPTLLYRALVAQSARWPQWIRSDTKYYEFALRTMGYGIPDSIRATHNDEYRITFLTDKPIEIGKDEAHLYRIPIPEEISSIGEDYDILVEVTLSYSAKPRRTRRSVKRYLSTWVDWCCSRAGESFDTFARRVYQTGSSIEDDGNFNWTIGDATNRGQANKFSTKNGTLLKDWAVIKSNQLGDAFGIAVRGHEGWGALFKANYSLVVSFEAIEQNIPLYESIRTAVEVEVGNTEIEMEVSDLQDNSL